jgi:hypothetical protein
LAAIFHIGINGSSKCFLLNEKTISLQSIAIYDILFLLCNNVFVGLLTDSRVPVFKCK